MRDQLEALVNAESPSNDPELCIKASRVLFDIVGREPDLTETAHDGREHYVWRWPGSGQKIIIIGHLDTVWPAGTVARWPFSTHGDKATGPGCYDMKCGLVVAAKALSNLLSRNALHDVTLLVNSDEELGSITSRELIEKEASGAKAALIMESGAIGAVKVARKGVGMYQVHVQGRAAHAGLEPEKGVNALVEASHQVLRIATLGDSSKGTSVTPTMSIAGTAHNVVPASAEIEVDVRVKNIEESDRVDAALRALRPVNSDAVIRIEGGPNRPPMERAQAEPLYALTLEVGASIGFQPRAIEVGGGSDGNFTAAIGVPTIDGLGGDGAGAHAEGEWVALSSLPVRVALLEGLIERLTK
ncbi:MAG: M20/M25/M40 family metallo-hydrolase [Actinomycetota bacterium]